MPKWGKVIAVILTVGGAAGWGVTILGFFGVDANALRTAVQGMKAHSVFLILSFVSLVIFITGLYLLRKRSRITPENVRARIMGWLDAFHLNRRILNDANCHFAFEATLQTGIPVAILRTRDHPHYITLLSRLSFTPEQKNVFDNLSESEKQRFVRELRLEAAKSKISFSADSQLNNIAIERRIPITDTLTEANLFESIDAANFSAIIMLDTMAVGIDHRRDIRGTVTNQ